MRQLFGKRLPDIGKNLGRTIVEFKKGLNSTGEEINKAVNEWYELHGEDVAGNDFIIDLEKVKSTVSASTKKMLGLK